MNSAAMVIGYMTIVCFIGLVLAFLYVLADEARRAYRQCRRIERIVLGKGKRADWRVFMKRWRSEYLDNYTSLNVRGYVLPHDTRRPIKREFLG